MNLLKALIACAVLAPSLAQAQDYGDQRLVQTYTTMDMSGLFPADVNSSTAIVVPLDDGGFVEFNCPVADSTDCWTVRYADIGNAVSWGETNPAAPIEQVLEGLTPVETVGLTGGPVFPLRDGAEITWTEIWRSEGFDADYEMRLTVTCCEVAPKSNLAFSGEVWVLVFSYENPGEVGEPHGGAITFRYDAALKVIVSISSSNWWGDENEQFLRFSMLQGFDFI